MSVIVLSFFLLKLIQSVHESVINKNHDIQNIFINRYLDKDIPFNLLIRHIIFEQISF